MNSKRPIAEKRKNSARPQIPTSPRQWRVAVGIDSVTFCAGVKEVLDVFLATERRSAMERRFSFCTAVPHKASGLPTRNRRHVRVRSACKQQFHNGCVFPPIGFRQRGMQWRLARIYERSIDVRPVLNEVLAQPPVTVK